MFEDDMILPDDFQMDTPQSEEVSEESQELQESTAEFAEDTKPAEEVNEPVEETPQMVKLRYNHEDEEVTLEEAIQLAQMGKNYPKLQEKLQSLETDPRLNFIEELAQQHGMTGQEYMEAVRQQREQAKIDELVSQGISEELAQEINENKKFREQYENEKKAKAEEEKKNQDFAEFFDYFRQANGREYVPNQDAIPENVWESVNQGVPLKFAYMAHENTQLRTQLSALKQNKANASKAPVGSVTAHGGNEIASDDPFLAGFDSI
jgi:hypothetical protein